MAAIKKGRLFFDTDPSNVWGKILKSDISFAMGIELDVGSYTVWVTAAGLRLCSGGHDCFYQKQV